MLPLARSSPWKLPLLIEMLVPGSGDTEVQHTLAGVPAPDDDSNWWDQEHERRLFAWAAEQVRPAVEPGSWQAFWGTAVDGRPPKEVGAELKLSPGAVYVAKSRVLARLRDEVRKMMDEEENG